MGLFNINDEVYAQLIHLVYANFKKLEPKGRSRTYSTTMVKDYIITSLLPQLRALFISILALHVPTSMSSVKDYPLYLEKYTQPSKIKKSNQFPTQLSTLTS